MKFVDDDDDDLSFRPLFPSFRQPRLGSKKHLRFSSGPRTKPGRQTTFGAFLVYSRHLRVKLQRFDWENCKTEAYSDGCLGCLSTFV